MYCVCWWWESRGSSVGCALQDPAGTLLISCNTLSKPTKCSKGTTVGHSSSPDQHALRFGGSRKEEGRIKKNHGSTLRCNTAFIAVPREEGVGRRAGPWPRPSPVSWQWAEQQRASAVPQEQAPSAGLCHQGATSLEGMLKQGRRKAELGPKQARGIQAPEPSNATCKSFHRASC